MKALSASEINIAGLPRCLPRKARTNVLTAAIWGGTAVSNWYLGRQDAAAVQKSSSQFHLIFQVVQLGGLEPPTSCSTDRTNWLRERDSKWIAQNPLLNQVNRRPDFVLRYEAFGERCILQPHREQLRRPHQILLGEIFGKIRGILASFGARGTAC